MLVFVNLLASATLRAIALQEVSLVLHCGTPQSEGVPRTTNDSSLSTRAGRVFGVNFFDRGARPASKSIPELVWTFHNALSCLATRRCERAFADSPTAVRHSSRRHGWLLAVLVEKHPMVSAVSSWRIKVPERSSLADGLVVGQVDRWSHGGAPRDLFDRKYSAPRTTEPTRTDVSNEMSGRWRRSAWSGC